MAKYPSKMTFEKSHSKSNYDWKTSRTTIEDNSRRTSGTINELKAFEERLGLVTSVPEKRKKTSVLESTERNKNLMETAAAAKIDADDVKSGINNRVDAADDRTPSQESLKTEEVHEVRNLITKDEEEKTIAKVKKHLDTFIGKGSVVKRQDALSMATYAFRLGMIYHQKGSIDKYLEKK